MSDAVQSWEPSQLVPAAVYSARQAWNQVAASKPIAPIDHLRVLPDVPRFNPGALEWLSAEVRNSVEVNVSVSELLLQGRELLADHVLRTRSIHRGQLLRAELRWNGPAYLVSEQIVKLAHSHQRILASNGEEARKLRFKARLQSMDLEGAIVAYAATELIDPKIMDSDLTLAVLCHADQEMTPDVILRLGLARAQLDEVDEVAAGADYMDDALWSLAQAAWHANTLLARGVATKWANAAVSEGRSHAELWRRF